MSFEQELRILRKYKEGRDIDDEDSPILDELASVGFMHKGFSLRRNQPTAKTTDMGRSLI